MDRESFTGENIGSSRQEGPQINLENLSASQRPTFVMGTSDSMMVVKALQSLSALVYKYGLDDDQLRQFLRRLDELHPTGSSDYDDGATDVTAALDDDRETEAAAAAEDEKRRAAEAAVEADRLAAAEAQRVAAEEAKRVAERAEADRQAAAAAETERAALAAEESRLSALAAAEATARAAEAAAAQRARDSEAAAQAEFAAAERVRAQRVELSSQTERKAEAARRKAEAESRTLNLTGVVGSDSTAGAADDGVSTRAVVGGPKTSPRPVVFKWVRMVCPGKKVPVRAAPNVQAEILRYIQSGDRLHVAERTVAGFWQLNNMPVSALSVDWLNSV
jgi:hypothetical protein